MALLKRESPRSCPQSTSFTRWSGPQAFVDFTQDSYFNESKTGDGDLLPDVVVIKRYIKLAIAMNGPNRTHINAFTLGEPPIAQRPWDHVNTFTNDWAEYAKEKCNDFSWAVN